MVALLAEREFQSCVQKTKFLSGATPKFPDRGVSVQLSGRMANHPVGL